VSAATAIASDVAASRQPILTEREALGLGSLTLEVGIYSPLQVKPAPCANLTVFGDADE
jgi:hypothetical protein